MVSSTLSAGLATGIGSLPHREACTAAAVVLRCLPDLPAAPQLPARSPREGMLAQWALGIPGVEVRDDGTIDLAPGDHVVDDAPIDTTFDPVAHDGLLTFLDQAAARARPPSRVKVQVTGPLTLGLALLDAGLDAERAFRASSRAARAWAVAVEGLVADRLPDARLLLFFDEPGLVRWQRGDAPLDHESATDLLSGALAAPSCVTGVHACGDADLRVAFDAGPRVLGVAATPRLLEHAAALGRFLEGDGWVAWGAVPTDGPVGEDAGPLWRALVELWCELTRRGCDPVRLRGQALVTPACGLGGHGPSQAERAMLLAREIGGRVHEQAAATRLSVGA